MARPLSIDMHTCLMLDMSLTPAMYVDFGVDTADHHRALQTVVRKGATVEELDEALGNGEKLNALMKKYEPRWLDRVAFKTAYDS